MFRGMEAHEFKEHIFISSTLIDILEKLICLRRKKKVWPVSMRSPILTFRPYITLQTKVPLTHPSLIMHCPQQAKPL